MALRMRFSITTQLSFVVLCGIGFTYARAALGFAWHMTPFFPIANNLTPTQVEAEARKQRTRLLVEFAIYPVVIVLLIGLSVLIVRFLVNFLSSDFTKNDK